MIASIRGTVVDIGLDRCVIETGGVGLVVHTTPPALAGLRRGEEGHLHTEMVVREDSLTLFGFDSVEARSLFTTVQTVSGIGPRLALAVIATLEPAALVTALGSGDVKTLTRVPGVGKRTAERLVLELKDKAAALGFGEADDVGVATGAPGPQDEVVTALEGLGFSAEEAGKAAGAVIGSQPEIDPASALRLALKSLGGR